MYLRIDVSDSVPRDRTYQRQLMVGVASFCARNRRSVVSSSNNVLAGPLRASVVLSSSSAGVDWGSQVSSNPVRGRQYHRGVWGVALGRTRSCVICIYRGFLERGVLLYQLQRRVIPFSTSLFLHVFLATQYTHNIYSYYHSSISL
jgi:hypothetical protein